MRRIPPAKRRPLGAPTTAADASVSTATPARSKRRRRTLDTASLLTRAETAAVLKVTVRTVDRMLRTGTLTPVRIGRSVRIYRVEIEELVWEPNN